MKLSIPSLFKKASNGVLLEDGKYEVELQYWHAKNLKENESRLRPIDESKLVHPALQILRPAVDALKVEDATTPIAKMWRELLANASDLDNLNLAHPSIPPLISRLSSDEARILEYLRVRPKERLMINILGEVNAEGRLLEHAGIEAKDKVPGIIHPENYQFYFENLISCGLIQYHQWKYVFDEEPIFGPTWVFPSKHVPMFKVPVQVRLTQVGIFFMSAVSSPEETSPEK